MITGGGRILESAGELLDRYRAFAIDLDGVVWRGGRLLEGAVEGLQAIAATGKPFILLTNNGAYRPSDVLERLNGPGIELTAEQVLTSAVVARKWIAGRELTGARSFILAGPNVVGQLSDVLEVRPMEPGEQAEFVLVGRYEEFNYSRLAVAADSVRDGAAFLCLNRDPVMPVEGGRVVPGTGTIVAAMEVASGRPATVLGKPELPMMQAAADLVGTDGVLMIGDRVESDIAGARKIGWDGALVLTGLSVPDAVMDPAPDYVVSSLGAFARKGAEV
ncbi:MAG: HAD-IIA family hydrolase [Actinomycetota bacterium]